MQIRVTRGVRLFRGITGNVQCTSLSVMVIEHLSAGSGALARTFLRTVTFF